MHNQIGCITEMLSSMSPLVTVKRANVKGLALARSRIDGIDQAVVEVGGNID